MLESVNIDSSVAVYVQIENAVQFAIASGELKAGDKLPSVSELSLRLGINPNTVMKAYRELEVVGVVRARRGMGVYIQEGVAAKVRDTCRRNIMNRLHEVVGEAKAAGMPQKAIKAAVDQCLASEAGPYDPPPKAVAALAKSKKPAK